MNLGTNEVLLALLLGFGISLLVRLSWLCFKLIYAKRFGRHLELVWQWPQGALVPLFLILISLVIFIATCLLVWRSFAATIGFTEIWTLMSMALITRRLRKALGVRDKSVGFIG